MSDNGTQILRNPKIKMHLRHIAALGVSVSVSLKAVNYFTVHK